MEKWLGGIFKTHIRKWTKILILLALEKEKNGKIGQNVFLKTYYS
jgi:hypothetical protein